MPSDKDIFRMSNVNNRFWKRYVDNTCVALPAKTCNTFLDHLNLEEPSIQFTLEKESDGMLHFLDTLPGYPPGAPSGWVYFHFGILKNNSYGQTFGLRFTSPICTYTL